MLIHFSYSSILLTDTSENALLFRDPVCDPEQLIRMEEQYMKIASRDHTLWGSEREGSTVICESMMISDEKRLDTPYIGNATAAGIFLIHCRTTSPAGVPVLLF